MRVFPLLSLLCSEVHCTDAGSSFPPVRGPLELPAFDPHLQGSLAVFVAGNDIYLTLLPTGQEYVDRCLLCIRVTG